MNTDQPSRDQKPGDSLRLRAFVARPGPIHHEDAKNHEEFSKCGKLFELFKGSRS